MRIMKLMWLLKADNYHYSDCADVTAYTFCYKHSILPDVHIDLPIWKNIPLNKNWAKAQLPLPN
jgi:hypothetical protein